MDTFHSFSLTHALCLLAVAALLALQWRWTPAWCAPPAAPPHRAARRLRRAIAAGCLIFWLLNAGYVLFSGRFGWGESLPLHYCNMANLIGAAAVLGRRRTMQSILYFWAGALCVWALVTPTLAEGPARAGFWIFWGYHLFIGLAVVHVLRAERFRPTARDLAAALAWTLAYTLALAALDAATGWDYGFVGPALPQQSTPLEHLGPYPWRVATMILLAAAAFTALWLAGRRRGGARPEDSILG